MGEAVKRTYGNERADIVRLNPPHAKRRADDPDAETSKPKVDTTPKPRTGTDLVPYQDVERFGFQHLRTRGGRTPAYIFWPLKLVRTALLLIAFLAFSIGLYENVSWSLHTFLGTPTEGTVVKLEAASAGLSTPAVDYVYPLDLSTWRVESRLPRDDLAVGDRIGVSVIAGSEGMTRVERSEFWRTLSLIALVGGGLAMWGLFAVWRPIETAMGWRRQEEEPASSRVRQATAILIVLALGSVAWMKIFYMPWVGVAEYQQLITAPDELMRKAALRCGPSGDGPLNGCELRALTLGDQAGSGAYIAALNEYDYESLARYNSAIADPEIDFAIDWTTAAPLLLERDPAILTGLLQAGAVPPPGVAFDLMAMAETRGWTEVSKALKASAQPDG